MTIKDIKKQFPLAFDTLKFPLKYDEHGQMIFDADNDHVLDIRGWGSIQYMDQPFERQDQIGKMIVEVLNTLYQNQTTQI